jgi:hypothetical protein
MEEREHVGIRRAESPCMLKLRGDRIKSEHFLSSSFPLQFWAARGGDSISL